MGDKSLHRELRRWATEEFNFPPESLPHESYMKTLCVGSGAPIWKYVIRHVFQEKKVRVIRGNLQWYRVLQDKELKKLEGQSEAVRCQELQQEIEQLTAELAQLDSHINDAEEQLAAEEQSVSESWARYEESRSRELLLQAFRQRCVEDRHRLSADTNVYSTRRHFLEQLSRRAEVELSLESPALPDGLSGVEPLVLREVRGLCEERVAFYQTLQADAEKKVMSTPSEQLTRDQMEAVFKHWISAVQDLLQTHPPSHILTALHTLASQQQNAVLHEITSTDVPQPLNSLKVQEEMPPVKSLFQAAWADVEQSLIELAQVRFRTEQLRGDVCTLRNEVELTLLAQLTDTQRAVFGEEMQRVAQAAMRCSVEEQCIQLELRSQERQEELRNLRNQWKSVVDFRQLLEKRQEQVQGLIQITSSTKSELIRVHAEIRKLVKDQLVPQLDEVIQAASVLHNSVSQEARQFGNVSMASLDCRVIEGEQRVPATQLSIYRLNSAEFRNLCKCLEFPINRAPEDLLSQAVFQRWELRFLRGLLQRHSSSQARLQKLSSQLPAPDQNVLLQRVRSEDSALLQTLLPLARELLQRCSMGLAYAAQVKVAVQHWWEQPAQFSLGEVRQDGLTFQQWLQRWKMATKEF
ncbi:HAUS augmin-like complex subunit 5 [Denticeps clupeoides]|uniref:HAUS augmin-like complex subunit 5 n=1 Tax=Denticeps clupeoides TaxID=299321 RepID=UPI0010A3CEAC|nr:HAUS augmin-like complex subunit 5 [Denticeps clupeoides]